MYTETLILSGERFIGTLDMEVLKLIQEDLLKMYKRVTIPDIFIKISEKNMDAICSLVLQSISKQMNISQDYIADLFIGESDEKLRTDNYINLYKYVGNLLEKCMPKDTKQQEESEFVDIPIYKTEDWDLAYMQFLWETTMDKKTLFWNVTPKNFFEQINVFKEVNEIEDEEVEWL